jgi:DNA-binding transcriptional LysR family regulator
MLAAPLHFEQYVAIAAHGGQLDGHDAIGWEALAAMPLCLLHQGMQYRRILDREFAQRGLSASPQAIADNYVSMYSLVRSGAFVSVVPDAYAGLMAGLDWCRSVPIAPQADTRRLGLVVVNRSPLGAMARAGLTAAQQFDPCSMIDNFYQTSG